MKKSLDLSTTEGATAYVKRKLFGKILHWISGVLMIASIFFLLIFVADDATKIDLPAQVIFSVAVLFIFLLGILFTKTETLFLEGGKKAIIKYLALTLILDLFGMILIVSDANMQTKSWIGLVILAMIIWSMITYWKRLDALEMQHQQRIDDKIKEESKARKIAAWKDSENIRSIAIKLIVRILSIEGPKLKLGSSPSEETLSACDMLETEEYATGFSLEGVGNLVLDDASKSNLESRINIKEFLSDYEQSHEPDWSEFVEKYSQKLFS